MGVRVDPVDEAVKGDLQKLTGALQPAGKVGQAAAAYVFDGRLNDSFRALNMLVEKGVAVRRVDKAPDPGVRAGDFIVGAGSEAVLASAARETGVDFTALKADVKQGTHDVRRLCIGMYQRYSGGNMDEGWTRFLIEQFGFHAIFDHANPLAYGMPSDGLLLFWNSQAFEIVPTDSNEDYEIVVRYPERDLLQSGWLIGEENLFRTAAMVSAKYGQGKVVLIGFRPQARAQTHGTFKLLFNALVQ